jgi:uncharacterized cupin superfamily protein
VVRLADVGLSHERHGAAFEAHLGSVAAPAGARHLGMRLCVIPPGKSTWPFHCHHANDEAFVILAGEGSLRFGAELHPFQAGDVLVCPAGGPETAHRLTNTGPAELRYLAVSSMREPDVMEYPDSGKWGAFAGAPPGGDPAGRTFSAFVRADARVSYWTGEAEED